MNAGWSRRGGWGGVLLACSALLPWIGDLYGSEPGYRVPLALAWDLDAPSSPIGLGLVLAAIGVVVIVASLWRGAWMVRQVAAGLGLLLTIGVFVQVIRFADQSGAGVSAWLNGLAFGAYVALAGAMLALLAPVPAMSGLEPEPASVPFDPTPVRSIPEGPCGHENRPGVRFCEECGEAIPVAGEPAGAS